MRMVLVTFAMSQQEIHTAACHCIRICVWQLRESTRTYVVIVCCLITVFKNVIQSHPRSWVCDVWASGERRHSLSSSPIAWTEYTRVYSSKNTMRWIYIIMHDVGLSFNPKLTPSWERRWCCCGNRWWERRSKLWKSLDILKCLHTTWKLHVPYL